MITASKLELAERCPGNLTLPHVDEPNEFSEAGNRRHAEDEEAIGAGDVPEVYAERWPGLAWQSEVSYAYDVSTDTARFLGIGLKRNYGALGPFEIAGTIDAEGRAPGVLVVVDRKSFDEVTPAASNPQVRFLALAAARALSADKIQVAINHELAGLDAAEIDPMFDLDVIAHDIKQLVVRSAAIRESARAGEAVPFNTGRWCRWCSAFAACPKQQELRSIVEQGETHPAIARAAFLDDEDAPDVYDLWKRLGILHKRIGQSLYAFASSRPIRLSSGKMFGPVQKQGNEKLDGDVVYQVVRDLHGADLADRAVVRQATKKRLDEALKGKRGAAVAVLKVVRERGGSERKASTAIEEYEPGPKLLQETDQ
jgi:hypothetical protein